MFRDLEGKEPNRSTPSSGGYGGALIGLWRIGSRVKFFHQKLNSSVSRSFSGAKLLHLFLAFVFHRLRVTSSGPGIFFPDSYSTLVLVFSLVNFVQSYKGFVTAMRVEVAVKPFIKEIALHFDVGVDRCLP